MTVFWITGHKLYVVKSTGSFNYVSRTFISGIGMWEGKEEKKWVGNSLKTIVFTAAKDMNSCYCSQSSG